MPLRMTGMISGMDTESIIQDLVAVRRKKVDTKKKAQTKMEWKQEAWKDLNQKLKNLQSKYLSNMRFTSSYSKKKSKVSNSSAVSVITGESAVNGVQTMRVGQLAKTGYLTGAKLEGKDGELTALSKLSDLKGFTGLDGDGTGRITFAAGGNSVDLEINENTTISDVLSKAKELGLNANFDAKQQRIFISSRESGKANDFTITASDANGDKALAALGLQTEISSDAMAGYRELASYYNDNRAGGRAAVIGAMRSLIDDEVASKRDAYIDQYNNLAASKSAAQDRIDEINSRYAGVEFKTAEEYRTELQAKIEEIDGLDSSAADYETRLADLTAQKEALQTKLTDAEELESARSSISSYDSQMAEMTGENGYLKVESGSLVASDKLKNEVENDYYQRAEYAAGVVDGTNNQKATKVSGQDAVIYLNDAEFTSSGNTFEINGLTITALAETNENITITTEQDTDGIYDMIKGFLKEYNALVNEMDKLYNADAAKGYEPLLDDEKDAMSDSEVEKWEKKIKDSLLRRDENLSSVNSALQSFASTGIEINGRTMYLSDFGINTLGYFTAPENEKHALHIDGDADDEYTSGNADKLKSMIASDPDTVISFFTKLSQDLYGKMSDMSKSVNGYRTYGNFYDDKKMKSDYDSYTSKIKQMEDKLAAYEDSWYKKFSKMETALAKMQSNANAVTGLFGGGN